MTLQTKDTTLLRLGGWAAYASAVVGAAAVAFLIAMLASFASGAMETGTGYGRVNDVLAIFQYLLAVPCPIALHALLPRRSPFRTWLVTMLGVSAFAAVVVLQTLLVVGALPFNIQGGLVIIALLVLGVWMVLTGSRGSASGLLPHGVRMGLVGATYFGYPIWAFWLGRHLLRLARPRASTTDA